MKRIAYSLLVVICLLITTEHIVAQTPSNQEKVKSVLAKMPCQNKNDFNGQMSLLMQNASESILQLAQMLLPAEKANNAQVEYAICGAVAFCSSNNKWKNAVKEGLEKAIPQAVDKYAEEFLKQQLRLLSSEEDVTYTEQKGQKVYISAYRKLDTMEDKASKSILKALGNKDRAYRMQALKYAAYKGLIDDELAEKVTKKYSSYPEETQVDIINWLGDNKVESQKLLLLQAAQQDGTPSKAAIEALGRIGGNDALEVLLGQLGTENNEEAFRALCSFQSDISSSVASSLSKADGNQQLSLLRLAGQRHIHNVAPQLIRLTESKDDAISNTALEVLPNVVTISNRDEISALLQKADVNKIPFYQKALSASLKGQDAQMQHETICALMEKACNKENFYPILASTQTDASVDVLQKIGTPEAINALKMSQNHKAAAPLLQAAKNGDEEALSCFVSLIDNNVSDIDAKYYQIEEALSVAKSTGAKENILNSLASIPCRNSFLLVGSYLDDEELGYAAAVAEKKIFNGNKEDIEYEKLSSFMNKAIARYEKHGTADDGYAVNEIKTRMSEVKPPIHFELPQEERDAGFELLFDGKDLSKWTGNKVNYLPINEAIVVVPDKTADGSLYTEKDYRNFVLRFEFAFYRGGANNGIGIRNPLGKYGTCEGMCECQVLDHDDPMYAGWLQDWQVHGSVYGVIPAKRIKHKPLGEWGTEEIRVEDNHITVTVNGEVILDGDVKEACQGHNVDPGGSNVNPYTPAHYNHPGMFNKTGRIAFLGHGPGVKFRNIRILDLSGKKK